MMELLYSSGLRLAELVALDLSDVPRGDDLLEVTGKGAKTRRLPVGRFAREALARWLKVRGQLAVEGEPALFVGTRGHRISPRMVQRQLQRLVLCFHSYFDIGQMGGDLLPTDE